MEGVCATHAVTRANSEYGAPCARVGIRASLSKTRITPGRGTSVESLPAGFEIDERAVVLRHSGGTAVPALLAEAHANGSQLAEGSGEVKSIKEKRERVFKGLRDVHLAGLKSQFALGMLRVCTAGDCVFVARACGIPAREAASLDSAMLTEVSRYLGGANCALADTITSQKIFLRSVDGGLGFQSVVRTVPAA